MVNRLEIRLVVLKQLSDYQLLPVVCLLESARVADDQACARVCLRTLQNRFIQRVKSQVIRNELVSIDGFKRLIEELFVEAVRFVLTRYGLLDEV